MATSLLRNCNFYVRTTLNVMFPCTHPYTNCVAACTCVYNGHYSRTSSRRERAPSRINGIKKDSQKDVDCSGKALSKPVATGLWLMKIIH